MTTLATQARVFYTGNTHTEQYNGDTDTIEDVIVDDRSLTKAQHLTLFHASPGLLRHANPFAMPTDVKRQSSRSKTITLDADTDRFNKYPSRT